MISRQCSQTVASVGHIGDLRNFEERKWALFSLDPDKSQGSRGTDFQAWEEVGDFCGF